MQNLRSLRCGRDPWWPGLRLVLLIVTVAACEFSVEPPPPAATASPSPAGVSSGPAISIDESWTAVDQRWTFTGFVDPRGSPTDVVLEVGYDIANPRSFEERVPVDDDRIERGRLSATIDVPTDRPTICVRFTATSEGGSGSSRPLCTSTSRPSLPVVVVSPVPSSS